MMDIGESVRGDLTTDEILYEKIPALMFWGYTTITSMCLATGSFWWVDWLIEDRKIKKYHFRRLMTEHLVFGIYVIIMLLLTMSFLTFYSYSLLPESYYPMLNIIFNIIGLLIIVLAIYFIILVIFRKACELMKVSMENRYSIKEIAKNLYSHLKKKKEGDV